MKNIQLTALALLLLTLSSASGEPTRTNLNPALIYYQAMLMAPKKSMSDADWDYLGSAAGREQKLPERFGPILANYDSQFKLVRAAARQKVACDWGIDMSPGPGTMLPHLAPIKAVSQAAQIRAIWDLQQGNQAAAREDLLAAFVLGRNAARDGTLIGTLVQQAVEAILYATVAGNFGQFTPETLQELAAGFEAAPARGLVTAAIRTEQSNHVAWVTGKIQELQRQNPDNDAQVLAAIRADELLQSFEFNGDEGKPDTNFWPRVFTAAGGTSDGILKLVRDTQPLYERIIKLLTLPQPEFDAQVQPVAAEVKASQNPFVQALAPDPLRIRTREFKIEAWQAMVRAAVEYKLHGEAGFKRVLDPFGHGPFMLERFVFAGVDRGFELKSAYAGLKYPCALIFVEKTGPAFRTDGPYIGQAIKP